MPKLTKSLRICKSQKNTNERLYVYCLEARLFQLRFNRGCSSLFIFCIQPHTYVALAIACSKLIMRHFGIISRHCLHVALVTRISLTWKTQPRSVRRNCTFFRVMRVVSARASPLPSLVSRSYRICLLCIVWPLSRRPNSSANHEANRFPSIVSVQKGAQI